MEKNLKEKEISSLDIMYADYPQQYLDKHYEDLIKFYPNTKDFSLRLTFLSGVAIFRFHYIDFTKFKLLILDIDLTSDNNILIEFNDCQFNKICDVDNSSKNKFTEYELVFRFNSCSFKNESEIEFQTLFGHITNLIYKIKFEFFDIKRDRENREKVSIKIYDNETLIKIKLENIDIINSKIMGECLILDSLNTKISITDFNKKIEIKNSDIEFENVDFSNQIELRNNSSIKVKKNSTIQNLVCSEGAKAIEINNCSITNSTFNGEIIGKAIFNKVTFENPPEIGDIKFKNCNVDFLDVKFGDINSSNAIAGFRALNKACRDANYHHGEIFFHGLELETRFNMLVERSYLFKFFLFLKGFFSKNIKPVFFQSKLVYFIKYISYFIISFFIISKDGIERFLLSFHRLFSDFGRSLLLPLFCLVVISIFVWGLNFTQINSSKNITEDLINNECEIIKINVNELPKINSKIVFKNAFGPLQLALPKDFISDCESKFYNQNSNSIIYFLNFFHAVISSGIWFIWFFMIRARFKL